MPMESWVKYWSQLNISGASHQNRVAAFSWTTEADWDFFQSWKIKTAAKKQTNQQKKKKKKPHNTWLSTSMGVSRQRLNFKFWVNLCFNVYWCWADKSLPLLKVYLQIQSLIWTEALQDRANVCLHYHTYIPVICRHTTDCCPFKMTGITLRLSTGVFLSHKICFLFVSTSKSTKPINTATWPSYTNSSF